MVETMVQETGSGPIVYLKDFMGFYRGTFGTVRAVDGVNLTIHRGEIVGIAGESGSGKSTLVELLTGCPSKLLFYEGGDIYIDGRHMYQIDKKTLRLEILCKIIGYVPQSSMNSLNPVKKIRDFLYDVMEQRNIGDQSEVISREEMIKRAIEHFDSVGLSSRVLDLYPHELSGGMKQRTVIAISTLWNPKLLIADEPTSALDVTTQKQLIEMLLNLKRKKITETIIIVSHDLPTLAQICSRCVIMYSGRVFEDGTIQDIINNPQHPYTKGLVSSIASFNPDGTAETSLKSIHGRPPDLRNPPSGCRFHPRCPYMMPICKEERPPDFFPYKPTHPVACWLYKDGANSAPKISADVYKEIDFE